MSTVFFNAAFGKYPSKVRTQFAKASRDYLDRGLPPVFSGLEGARTRMFETTYWQDYGTRRGKYLWGLLGKREWVNTERHPLRRFQFGEVFKNAAGEMGLVSCQIDCGLSDYMKATGWDVPNAYEYQDANMVVTLYTAAHLNDRSLPEGERIVSALKALEEKFVQGGYRLSEFQHYKGVEGLERA